VVVASGCGFSLVVVVILVVAATTIVVKGHEMEREGDEGVDGDGHEKVEVEGNEVDGETKLNKFN